MLIELEGNIIQTSNSISYNIFSYESAYHKLYNVSCKQNACYFYMPHTPIISLYALCHINKHKTNERNVK